MISLRRAWLRSSALALIVLGLPAHAAGGDRESGEHIARRECAGCHGIGIATGVTIQGVFVPSFSEIARRPFQTRERLKAFVLIPRHPMPGLPLREDEVRNLVEYIFSLRD
jgi:mono/diheme cytochrome c family protein